MTSTSKARQRTFFFAALAAMLLAAVVGGTSIMLVRDRKAALDAVKASQGNMALALERDILRNIDIYDLSLRAAAGGLRLLAPNAEPAVQAAILFDGSTAARHFRPIVIADEMGTVLLDAASPVPRLSSVGGTPFYALHRQDPDLGLLVLLNVRSSIDGRPYLSMTRRVSRPDGSFAGTVSGGLDLAYFRDIFSRFALPEGGVITLVGYDGRLVAGYPFREERAGMDVSGAGVVAHAVRHPAGSFEATSVIDGVTRVATIQKLGNLPFFLTVATPVYAVYADWRERATAAAGALFAVLAVAILLFIALRRELTRRRVAEEEAVAALQTARLAERQVRVSEARYRLLAENTSDVITSLDLNFTRTYASPACRAVFGHEPDDLLSNKPAAMMHPDDARAVYRAVRPLLAGEAEKTVVDYRARHKQGHWVPVEATISLVRHPITGEPASLVCTMRDVTERSHVEGRLRQAQRMEAVGQLTAGVAHDFNNMLQTQLGALALLEGEVADQPRARELAGVARDAGEHGARLTHSLLSFSRKQILEPRAVSLEALLGGLRVMLSRTLGPRIKLEITVPPGSAHPFADAAQLEVALLNLALNARDAMPDGGTLRMEATRRAADGAAGDKPADMIVLAISDTGCGMPLEVLARACEPFFTTKSVGRGSGLGLSMVHGFMQQSGGAIHLRSVPGQGTVVELWLPPTAAGGPVRTRTAPLAAPRRGGRILLVDDTAEVLAITGEMLEAAGFDVTQAAHGEEALLLLETEPAFDAMVTDWMMPGIDGGELIRRAAVVAPGLPALVVTGYAESDMLHNLPSHVRVLHKPLRGDHLACQISEVLGSAGKVRAVAQAGS